VPLIGGLCHAADFNQMWPELCPSLEDFVTQRTSTKCGPNCAPRQRTLSRSGLQPNVVQNVPLIGGLCLTADFNQMWSKLCPSLEDFEMQQTSTKCGPDCAPHWRTLSHCGFQPNVAQIVPLDGGLCHALDFNQMWPKLCPSLENFVTQQTLTKCGPKCAPRWRTLPCSGLRPNVVRAYAPHWRTLSHSGL
jgi:hypothetical protein